MLIYDTTVIGNRLLYFRKKLGFTQVQVAELANISDRTYADIERGTVNMRMTTALNICKVLNITPNDIFVDDSNTVELTDITAIISEYNKCSESQKRSAVTILSAYFNSLKK